MESGKNMRRCRNCGDEISEEEYESNNGLCDMCQWEEEDDDMILGGGF
jgi:NMD protein affecting ribosome stability and mRNA decay